MAVAVYRSLLGIAKETTPGTPVAPTSFLPVTSLKSDLKTHYLDDKGWRGSMVETYDYLPGPQHGEIDFGGNVHADTVGFLLQSLLPDQVTTGAAAPYATAFAAKNGTDGQPNTYTLTDYDAVQTRQFPSAKVAELTLKWSADGLLTYTAKASTLAAVSGATPTPSFSAARANASWASTVSVGGTARTTGDLVLDAEVSFKRKIEIPPAITGTVSPPFVWVGPLNVTFKLTTVFSSTVDYNAMVNNTQPALSVGFTTGSGATQTGLTVQMTSAAFTSAVPERGKDYVTLAVDGTARANTTDVGASGGFSPCKVTLTNALAAGAY